MSFVVLVGLPVASLALNAVSWLRFGIDLPFSDDWWFYLLGTKGSFDQRHIWQPISNTLAPVGYVLDALAQRYLDGNSVAYQFLSMILVLGGLLLMQWKLLRRALGDARLAAICFVFTLLMLQPGSYWGRDNLAYHQALPLLFILCALSLVLSRAAGGLWRIPIVCLLGLLAGFTYVSGAFAVLAAGLALLGLSLLTAPSAQRTLLLRGGATLSLVGAATSGVQLAIAVLPHAGATVPFAFPYQADFWFFLLGKIGRSLLLPPTEPLASLVAVLLVCAVAIAAGVAFVRRFTAQGDLDSVEFHVGAIYVSLAAATAVYLVLVAGGRTNLRPPEVQSALAVFAHGFQRFHFFWITLLWPWLVAAGLILLRSRGVLTTRAGVSAASVALLLAILFMISQGALRHAEDHRWVAEARRPLIACLQSQMQRGEGIRCAGLTPAWYRVSAPDITPAILYARDTGASFMRYFPILPVPIGADDPAPWFRLSRDASRSEALGIEMTPSAAMPARAGPDARLLLRVGRKDEMAACRLLDVDLLLRTERPDTVRVFFRPVGASNFDESWSRQAAVAGPSQRPQRLSFRLESVPGFDDQLRLDPVASAQGIDIAEIEVRCRLRGKAVQ